MYDVFRYNTRLYIKIKFARSSVVAVTEAERIGLMLRVKEQGAGMHGAKR